MNQADFRAYLQTELVKRCKQNPNYSLRAFSRSLGLESSFLSKLFKGSRVVTPKLIDRLADKLALKPQEIAQFKAQAGSKTSAATLTSVAEYQQLTNDHYQVIAEWYHYAILELITVKVFKQDSRWIARTLGITSVEVDAAIERMQRLGMLELNKKGKLFQPKNHTTVGSPHALSALKILQTQILKMAITALEETPIEERDQSAMTMAIDSSLLPEAKKKIRDFRRELCAFLQEGRKRDRVYHLSVSMYPVSKKTKGPTV